MMRFLKRWLAKINIILTNRITGLFAGWLPGFGILSHVGRPLPASTGLVLSQVTLGCGRMQERIACAYAAVQPSVLEVL
jgi:hypothetical protein